MKRSHYIDQWRGISVLLVICSHLAIYRFKGAFSWGITNWAMNAAVFGVCIFFVISGYLITSILLKEEQTTGRISLAGFYIRRAFRILPALLLYAATVFGLGAFGIMDVTEGPSALLFLCNTTAVSCGLHFGHLWSLGVEEQFYLVWPLLLMAAGRYRTMIAACTLVVASLISLLPSMRLFGWLNNGLAFACISIGALYALSPRFRALFVNRPPTWAMTLILVGVLPYALGRWAPLEPAILLMMPFLIVMTVIAATGPVFPPLRFLGLVSYSLYLWQEVFTHWHLPNWLVHASWLGVGVAWLSYRYLETPMIQLGRVLSAYVTGRRHAPA